MNRRRLISVTAILPGIFLAVFAGLVAARQSAGHPYASAQPLPEPRLFGEGVISTGDMELNAAFSPDGRTLYFTKRTPAPQMWFILVSHFQNGKWGEPDMAEFSGQHSDFDPFISPDGRRLFFCSNRPTDAQRKSDFDIWVADKTEAGPHSWSAPKRLEAPINTPAQEFYPSVAVNGTLYFSSNREGGKGRGDIYRARLIDGKYAEPENLGEMINSQFFEGDPYIAPDESYLIFVSYGRPEGQGDGDLYLSLRREGAWTKAVNLGSPINSAALDFCPIVSPDGKYFFFTSERGFAATPLTARLNYERLMKQIRGARNGLGDIYQVDIGALNLGRNAR
jgi:Tol biopolymer transport system component